MFDVSRFIRSIRLKPAIWEIGTKHYNDKYLRGKSWEAVGEKMFRGWARLTDEQREERLRLMKSKWKHIRDNYFKYTYNRQTNGNKGKRRKYMYANDLKFLKPILAQRGIMELIKEEVEMGPIFMPPPTYFLEIKTADNSRNVERPKKNDADDDDDDGDAKFKTPPPPAPPSADATEQRRVWLAPKYHDDDDYDKPYLFSFIPEYKNLTLEQKIDFRFSKMHYFKKIATEIVNQTLNNTQQ